MRIGTSLWLLPGLLSAGAGGAEQAQSAPADHPGRVLLLSMVERLKAARARAEKVSAGGDVAATARAWADADDVVPPDGRSPFRIESEEHKELVALIDEIHAHADEAAEQWADSPAVGLATIPPRDLIRADEVSRGIHEEGALWVAPPNRIRLENGALVLSAPNATPPASRPSRPARMDWGLGVMNGTPPTRVFWAPGRSTPIRHYELTFQATVIKNGFVLIARRSAGFLYHHSTLFETPDVLLARRTRHDSLRTTAGARVNAWFEPSIPVAEGGAYEIVQRVVGDRVHVRIKPLDRSAPIEPVEGKIFARRGAVGFELTPGAVLRLERASIRILH